MGHNSSPLPSDYPTEEKRREWRDVREKLSKDREKRLLLSVEKTLKVWPEGARADIPGIPNLNPNRIDRQYVPGADHAKRGLVSEFSHKSRRRLQRTLATMKLSEVAYTMALTLPGCDVSLFEHSAVMDAFEKTLRRLSATKRFPEVSGFWKRELQGRGAIHDHLILYGLGNDRLRAEFQAWIVRQWTSFFLVSTTPEQQEHHRWWHLRPENMQLVRDFSGYFSKYLGKECEAGTLPGRWWGSFNKRNLPKAPSAEVTLSGKAAVLVHRMARKFREVRINAGKHRADSAQLKKAGNLGLYNVTSVGLWRLRSGYDLNGYRNPHLAARQLRTYLEICEAYKVRPGKFRFLGKAPNTAPIVLCGASAPAFAARAIDFVNHSRGLSLNLEIGASRRDLTPNPTRPVPSGKIAVCVEGTIKQAEFLCDFHFVTKPAAFSVQIELDTWSKIDKHAMTQR